jgi:hypothetical protein
MTLKGTHSAIRKEQSAVVSDPVKWKALWKQHLGEHDNPLYADFSEELDIDFQTHYVVSIFAGSSTNCVLVSRIRGDQVVIRYAEEVFSTEGRPPPRTPEQELKNKATAPYTFVVLPKPIKTVVIEKAIDGRRKIDMSLGKEIARYPAPGDKK